MLNVQWLTRNCMIERSNNIFHTKNLLSHQNEFKNHADEKSELQEFIE